MVPLSPLRLISAATSFIGLGEEPDHEKGRTVERFRGQTDSNGAWDASFLTHVGYWSHFDHQGNRSSWPLPLTAQPDVMAAFAYEHAVTRAEPRVGDVALIWFSHRGAFARVGIVVDVGVGSQLVDGSPCFHCMTIEGNVGPGGRPGGATIARVQRRLCPSRGDQFIRWAEFDLDTQAVRDGAPDLRPMTIRRAA